MLKRLRDLPNCEDCPRHLRDAITFAFSNEELDELYQAFDANGKSLGIGFTGPGGKFCRHANPIKASVITLLEANLWEWLAEPKLLASDANTRRGME